jgi:hypothetical protein
MEYLPPWVELGLLFVRRIDVCSFACLQGPEQLRQSEAMYRAALHAEPDKSSNEALSTSQNRLSYSSAAFHMNEKHNHIV